MVYWTKCDFHVNENCSLHADMIKTFDTGTSVGLGLDNISLGLNFQCKFLGLGLGLGLAHSLDDCAG